MRERRYQNSKQEKEQLKLAIKCCYDKSRQTDGSQRIHAELGGQDYLCNRARITRFIQQMGL